MTNFCTDADAANTDPRISGRKNRVIDLNVDFLRSGVPTDPFAIRYVEIYRNSVVPHNLVATIPIIDCDDINYPSPACQEGIVPDPGLCGTAPTDPIVPIPGKYHLYYQIPDKFQAPDVYFDVWHYYATDPRDNPTSDCDIDDDVYGDHLLSCCHRFWVYPDEWFCNDGLQTVRFGFEPLDQKFYKPENRPLEVGLMPLPLYDYNFNLVNPLIPYLNPEILIESGDCELLVDWQPMETGLRQGSYRSNPWVVKYNLDTSNFMKGTYRYQIRLNLPDGTSRVSKKFFFTIN
jgi:hypothetical protein